MITENMEEPQELHQFIASLDLRQHPLVNAKDKLLVSYFTALEFFTNKSAPDSVYAKARLKLYKNHLLAGLQIPDVQEQQRLSSIKKFLDGWRPWTAKYRYLLFCDLALVLMDEALINNAFEYMKPYLSSKKIGLLSKLKDALIDNGQWDICTKYTQCAVKQYRANRMFWLQPERKYMVTANMSAGKSTLINALTGKKTSVMKSDASTTDVHYIYDEAFEDGNSSKWDGVLTLDADEKTLMDYDVRNKTGRLYVLTYFSTFVSKGAYRYCLIDTPGVNSSINREHGKLANKALREESYDGLIYVFNANRLGTEEEFRHLRFVSENATKENVVFVLNKLDDFNQKDDSIEESIRGLQSDLVKHGYENPIICPISAYFALLIKMKQNGQPLTEDENDEFDRYAKKFLRPEYDLSRYYDQQVSTLTDDTLKMLAVKCGLYGLENILYGGKTKP